MAKNQWAVGVDIGGTKIEIGNVDCRGKISSCKKFKTNLCSSSEATIGQLVASIKQIQSEAGTSPSAIGVGVPGQVEADTGIVRFAPNLGWFDVPLQDKLSDATGIRVAVINDVRAATYGEWLFGAGKEAQDIACIFIGTGIGGGIISGGKVLTGARNSAGEIGHITIAMDGPPCTCGNRGCFEAHASGWAIVKRTQDAIKVYPKAGEGFLRAAQCQADEITSYHILAAAKAGNSFAQQVIDQTIDAIVAGSVSIVNAFNPSHLIIGGGLGLAVPKLLERLDKEVRERALESSTDDLEILLSPLDGNAGVIGAAAYAMNLLLKII